MVNIEALLSTQEARVALLETHASFVLSTLLREFKTLCTLCTFTIS